MRTFNVQVSITDALVSFTVNAKTPEDALRIGREDLKQLQLWNKVLEHIDSTVEVTGVY